MQLWDRFTDTARQAVLLAHRAARQRGEDRMIGVTDILLGILKQGEGRAVEILQALNVDTEVLAGDLGASPEGGGRSAPRGRSVSPRRRRASYP